jgi:hypothetical protein
MRQPAGLAASIAILLATAACDRVFDPDPEHDGEPPVLRITTPDRGSILGDVSMVTVSGFVTDAEGDITEVTVNGVGASIGGDGGFTVSVPLVPGTNLVHASAKDAGNNEATDTRSVQAGPTIPLSSTLPDTIAAVISDEAFDAIGRAAAGFLVQTDLGAMIAPYNPVMEKGWSGPGDCLFGRVSITGMTVGGSNIGLYARTGGLTLDASLTDVEVHLHVEWAFSCLDGARDIVVRASQLDIYGDMNVGIAGSELDVALDNPDVGIYGLDIDLGGVPGEIVDLLALDTALAPILAWGVELFVAPMVENALSGLSETKTVSVLGKQISFEVTPAQVDFDTAGARIRLDSRIEVANATGPGFVYVANTLPSLVSSNGFAVYVADDAANQAFTGFWSAGGMTYDLPLSSGDYGEVGQLFDSVHIEALLPPSISAHNDGTLRIVVGDLIAEFQNGGQAVTKVAINGTVDIGVVNDGTGLRLQVSEPAVHVDFLDEGVDGANALDDTDFEALISFAATRLTHATSGLVGELPIPSVGGVTVDDLAIEGRDGYLTVGGVLR